MNITKKDCKVADTYFAAVPKQFGTLHERMKWLVTTVQKYPEKTLPNDLIVAIYDLETEIKYHEAVTPPFGQRTLPREFA